MKEERLTGIPICQEIMDQNKERLAGIPLCPESMDKNKERLAGIPLCPESMDKNKEITGLVVTGGTMDYGFAGRFLENRRFDKVIAVDGGLTALSRLHLKPDAIVGDFDTVSEDVLAEYKSSREEITWGIHKPEKDETDTELALNTAIGLGCTRLVLLGATGGRMDHFLGNLHLLYACLKKAWKPPLLTKKTGSL